MNKTFNPPINFDSNRSEVDDIMQICDEMAQGDVAWQYGLELVLEHLPEGIRANARANLQTLLAAALIRGWGFGMKHAFDRVQVPVVTARVQ